MALMLPRASPLVPAQHDTMTSDGKIALIANKGYLASARGNLQMCELLDSVKVRGRCAPLRSAALRFPVPVP